MGKADKKLATMLSKCGMISEAQRTRARRVRTGGVSFTQWIVDKQICSEDAMITTVASEMNHYPINLAISVRPRRDGDVTEEQANNYMVLPLGAWANC